jgi:mono/diheme cytochrome c family protein
MRTLFFILLPIITCLWCTDCFGQKKQAFSYPDDIADSAKKSFVKNFNQGKILYGISCAQCHNKKVNGADIIPDFSLPQLMDYEMRMYEQHENKLDDRHVSDAELEKIILFLRYKKKSGITVTPPPKLAPNQKSSGR